MRHIVLKRKRRRREIVRHIVMKRRRREIVWHIVMKEWSEI